MNSKGAPPPFRPLREELTDLPNLITLARIALIPFVLVWIDNFSRTLSALAALIFVIAAATDALDGYLARRLGLVTVLGKFLDPLADKLIVHATLIMLVANGRAPAWLVIILVSRDLAITGLRAIASQQGLVIAAGRGGKTKTALQLVGITFLLVHFPYEILLINETLRAHEIGIFLLYISLVLSLTSAIEYFHFFVAAAARTAHAQAEQGLTRAAAKDRLRRRKRKLRAMRKARRAESIQRRKQAASARRGARLARKADRRKRRR